jgi:hypothetical protein
MTINEAKSSTLKKILKVGEDVLVTHTGDSENPQLKSSTAVGAVNSNHEFVMVAEADLEQALPPEPKELANNVVCLAELLRIDTKDKNIETLIQEIESIANNPTKSILPNADINNNLLGWTAITDKGNDATNGAVLPTDDVNRHGKSSEDEEFDLLSDDSPYIKSMEKHPAIYDETLKNIFCKGTAEAYYVKSMVNAKPCPGCKQKMYLNVVCLKKNDAKISIPPEMIAEFKDFKANIKDKTPKDAQALLNRYKNLVMSKFSVNIGPVFHAVVDAWQLVLDGHLDKQNTRSHNG